MSFAYGAPWEPGSGAGWRDHVWRNRPCCFLHFELWKSLRGQLPFPEKSRRAVIGGRYGDLAPSSGFGMACGAGNAGVFFCNHTRFRWRGGKLTRLYPAWKRLNPRGDHDDREAEQREAERGSSLP